MNTYKDEYNTKYNFEHEDEKLNRAIWNRDIGLSFNTVTFISYKLAVFMGKTDEMYPCSSHVEATKCINKYVKDNNLQNPANKRQIIVDEKIANLFGIDVGYDNLTYFNLQSYLRPHMFKSRPNFTRPPYTPTPELLAFAKICATEIQDDVNSCNEDDVISDDDPAVIPEVLVKNMIEYINQKCLKQIVLKYDKPIYDLFGLTEKDTLTYDALAPMIRAKMYPKLADFKPELIPPTNIQLL